MILPTRTRKGGLLVVICTGDGRSHHHALWRQIQRGHKVSSGCEVQELWASEAPNGPAPLGCTPGCLTASASAAARSAVSCMRLLGGFAIYWKSV